MTGPGKCKSLLERRGLRTTNYAKKKPFYLKNALSLVSIDFHTPLRYLVAGMMWINVCHASDFKIVVLHLIVLETPARMMLHTLLASYIVHKSLFECCAM